MKRMFSILACLCILLSGMSVISVSAAEKNLVANPGFEEDLNLDKVESVFDPYLTWTPRDSSWCKIETTTEEAHSGSKSMKVSERAYWWATGYQVGYTFARKEPITFSAWVKLEKGSGDRFMHFCIFDKNGNDLIAMMGEPAEITATDKEWREIKGTFTPPGNVKEGFIGISYQPADSADPDQMNWAGAFYIDDVYISSASGTTTAGSTDAPILSNPQNTTQKVENTTTTTKKVENTTTTEKVDNATTTTVEGADATTTTENVGNNTTTGAADDGQSEQNTTTKAPASSDVAKDDGGSLAWLWIVLGAVVVIGAGAAVYFLVIKKSGK